MSQPLIIVLVGFSLSGKDTVAEYLEAKGFVHVSLSDTLREICKRRKSYKSRDDLIRIGNQLRKKYGTGYLAKLSIRKALRVSEKLIVLTSVRNPGEISEIKKYGKAVIIEVYSPQKVRYQRALKRGKIDDRVSYKKFVQQERFERKGSVHQQQLDKVMAAADFKIINNSSILALKNKIDRTLNKIEEWKIKNIVILGPQGSGKGTQAEIVANKFNLAHIETGKIFRKLAKQNSPLGKKINYLVNKKGRLLPSDFVGKILKDELRKISSKKGLVFDGYPRNLVQAKTLAEVMRHLKRRLTHVIYLPISRKSTIKRLSLRRTCEKCNRIFIQGVNIKKNQLQCPVCRGKIFQREDDKPKAIVKRLNIYNRSTKPVINFYKRQGILIEINGEPPIKVVARDILKKLS